MSVMNRYNIRDIRELLWEEKDPDELFEKIEMSLSALVDRLPESDPDEAVENLTVAMLVASSAYSRAVFLKLKQLEKKIGVKTPGLQRDKVYGSK